MSTLEAALGYRALGFSVLPLKGKAPYTRLIQRTDGSKSTRKLAARGASDEQVRDWFSRANVNVGIFCGEPSDGLVVDLDDCEFPLQGAKLPLTPLVKTGAMCFAATRAISAMVHATVAVATPLLRCHGSQPSVRRGATRGVVSSVCGFVLRCRR